MTIQEFSSTGCDNHHCRFTFQDGSNETGVITTFLSGQSDKYYLVLSSDMKKYRMLEEDKKEDELRKLLKPVQLEDIKNAERI